jgi:predicted RNA binding protein YcfA (HicA-like mRNA interferase family)
MGVGAVPLKVSEMIKIVVADGWYLDRVTGSHRQFRHTVKPGTTTIAGKLIERRQR